MIGTPNNDTMTAVLARIATTRQAAEFNRIARIAIHQVAIRRAVEFISLAINLTIVRHQGTHNTIMKGMAAINMVTITTATNNNF